VDTRRLSSPYPINLAPRHRKRASSQRPPERETVPNARGFLVERPLPPTPPDAYLPLFTNRIPTPVIPTQPFASPLVESPDSADLRNTDLHCYLPEQSFLALNLPTRSRRELIEFKNYCTQAWHQRLTHFIVYKHPLKEISDFAISPAEFEGYLWKTRVVLTQSSITEEYSRIQLRRHQGRPDTIRLKPAYTIAYPWNNGHWTINVV
jgi:hypothetical protein